MNTGPLIAVVLVVVLAVFFAACAVLGGDDRPSRYWDPTKEKN